MDTQKYTQEEAMRLKEKINEQVAQFIDTQDGQVEVLADGISKQFKELNADYLTYLRNISVISGVIAPFSLLLLEVDSLEIYAPLTVIGFMFLLVNIVVPQFAELTNLKRKDQNILNSTLHYFSANSSFNRLRKEKNVDELFKYTKDFETSLKHLQANDSYFTIDGIEKNVFMRQRLTQSVTLLTIGVFSIILSIGIFPIINSIVFIVELLGNIG